MAEMLDSYSGFSDMNRGQLTLSDSGKLKAPEAIVTNVNTARALFHKFRVEHLQRISLYAMIEGLIAGNPPYNPAELEKFGLSHITNVNDLRGRSYYDRHALAYWNLINETEFIAKFCVAFPNTKQQDPQILRINDTLSKHFTDVVKAWPSFVTHMCTMAAQLVKFGISPIVWHDERDWRWRTIELNKFYISDQCLTDMDQLTTVCVESFFPAQYLYDIYTQYEKKSKSPWNLDELKKVLLWFANSFAKTKADVVDWMELQRRMQNQDTAWNMIFSDNIRLVSLLNKEYNGKISHYMFERNYSHQDFLFKVQNQYDRMEDALVLFTASPGEFTVHSNRGIGHKIFAPCQALMQLDGSIFDMARLSSTPLIKSPGTGPQDFNAIRFYPGVPTNIGTAEIQENKLGANINQLVGASQYFTQKQQFVLANSGDDPSTPDADKGSLAPQQARAQAYKEFAVLKNNIAHFYTQYDYVIRGMVIKMLRSKVGYPGYEFVEEWKARCLEDGVPKEVFQFNAKRNFLGLPRQFRSVTASRVCGDGSQVARITGLQEMLPLVSSFGPKELKEYKRQFVMAALGMEAVSTFIPEAQEADEQAGGASLAGVENNQMQMGQSVVFSMENMQRAHFVTHMALATHTIQAIQQSQLDPIQAAKVFSVLVPHLAEHYQALANMFGEQEFAKQMKAGMDQVHQYAVFNQRKAGQMYQAQIKQQQEDQQATEQAMNEEQRKTRAAQVDEGLKTTKVMSQVERAKEASERRGKVMEDSARSKADNDRLKIQLEHGVNVERAQNEADLNSVDQNREALSEMNGETPAPYDIEGMPPGMQGT